MNKKLIIISAIVLFLAAAGWFFMSNKKSAPGPESAEIKVDSVSSAKTSSTLKDLLTLGSAQTCTYSTNEGSGKVYVSGGKVRGDFEVKAEGASVKSHMIVKDSTSYIWTDDQKTGFKMKFDASAYEKEGSDKDTSSTTTNGFDPNTNYNYSCSAWGADPNMFELPKGVTFSEFSLPTTGLDAPPGATGNNSGGGNPSQCSYCNALSGEDKTQCLKALNCN